MKSTLLAAATLVLATMALAQPAKSPEVLEIVQIIGVKQIDAATYEINARLLNGGTVDLRMNAFVMQDLGRQLGTYGRK